MYEVLILLVLVNLGFTSYVWRTVGRGPKGEGASTAGNSRGSPAAGNGIFGCRDRAPKFSA